MVSSDWGEFRPLLTMLQPVLDSSEFILTAIDITCSQIFRIFIPKDNQIFTLALSGKDFFIVFFTVL
jgi:hypothetical protein